MDTAYEGETPRSSEGGKEPGVMRLLSSPYLSLILRLSVGTWFILSGWTKTGINFEGVVMEYGVLPLWMVPTFAHVLPYVELLVGVCLFTGMFTHAASATSAVMNVVFIGAMSLALAQGKNYIDCGCLPWLKERIGPITIARDVVMILAAAQVYLCDRQILSMDAWLHKKD